MNVLQGAKRSQELKGQITAVAEKITTAFKISPELAKALTVQEKDLTAKSIKENQAMLNLLNAILLESAPLLSKNKKDTAHG